MGERGKCTCKYMYPHKYIHVFTCVCIMSTNQEISIGCWCPRAPCFEASWNSHSSGVEKLLNLVSIFLFHINCLIMRIEKCRWNIFSRILHLKYTKRNNRHFSTKPYQEDCVCRKAPHFLYGRSDSLIPWALLIFVWHGARSKSGQKKKQNFLLFYLVY